MKFRNLKAAEIDCRVGTVGAKGITLLLYKDARVDQSILDESNVIWQRRHYEVKGNLFCEVSIWNDEIKQWVAKSDCGTESNTEKEKGEASDSFKRACFNWGIGRELYTSPFIFIKEETTQRQGSKGYDMVDKYAKFAVKSITINEHKEITALTITKSNQVVFTFGDSKKEEILKYNCSICDKPMTQKNFEYSISKCGFAACSPECKEEGEANKQ